SSRNLIAGYDANCVVLSGDTGSAPSLVPRDCGSAVWMRSGLGNQRRVPVDPGGMPGLRTCTPLFPNPTLIAVNSCRCGINGSVSSGLLEPPYTEPYVRWCGRTAEVTPPPTRSCYLLRCQSPNLIADPKTSTAVHGSLVLVLRRRAKKRNYMHIR